MLKGLIVSNFHPSQKLGEEESKHFVLKTCQRTLIIHYGKELRLSCLEIYQAEHAYNFLLEVICGLQSKLVGENEIVGQFKIAYKEYALNPFRDNTVLLILEKLFKDSKYIRSEYLLGLSQKTYASIARKHIIGINKADEVLVLGSGHLAQDLINQFKKKAKVYISARNLKQANQLANEHDIGIIPWENVHMYKQFPFIANSIGAECVLFNEEFFDDWSIEHSKKLFVDLGSPSVIETQKTYSQGVMNLDDILSEGAIVETKKKNQIKKAKTAMNQLVERRAELLRDKLIQKRKRQQHFEFRNAL